jgi:hypothetical protein
MHAKTAKQLVLLSMQLSLKMTSFGLWEARSTAYIPQARKGTLSHNLGRHPVRMIIGKVHVHMQRLSSGKVPQVAAAAALHLRMGVAWCLVLDQMLEAALWGHWQLQQLQRSRVQIQLASQLGCCLGGAAVMMGSGAFPLRLFLLQVGHQCHKTGLLLKIRMAL